jgi:hypothetical protein
MSPTRTALVALAMLLWIPITCGAVVGASALTLPSTQSSHHRSIENVYYYHGGYYRYRYHGMYFRHRYYRYGRWHYY